MLVFVVNFFMFFFAITISLFFAISLFGFYNYFYGNEFYFFERLESFSDDLLFASKPSALGSLIVTIGIYFNGRKKNKTNKFKDIEDESWEVDDDGKSSP